MFSVVYEVSWVAETTWGGMHNNVVT